MTRFPIPVDAQRLRKLHNAVARRVPGPWARRRMVNGGGNGSLAMIDVGSAGGLAAPWDRHADELSFLMAFEPHDAARSSEHHVSVERALWSTSGEREFYVYGHRGRGSSLFRQNFEWVDANWEWLRTRGRASMAATWHERSQLVRTDLVTCITLDEVVATHGGGRTFDVLKIDAQGAELPILMGAERLLASRLAAIQLELFVFPLYTGIALIDDVVEYLANRGYRLRAALDTHGTFDSQHECLFLPEEELSSTSQIRAIYGV